MEQLAQYPVEPLTDDEQKQADGGCWVCSIWGPIGIQDPICPGTSEVTTFLAA